MKSMKKIKYCILFIIILCLSSNISYASSGMTKKNFKEALEKYNTKKVINCNSENELISYAYDQFVNKYKGIIIAYSGRLNNKDYEDISNGELTYIMQEVIAIDHEDNLYDGASLWGNIEYINKGIMKFDDFTLICISINYKYTKNEINELNSFYNKCIQEIYAGYSVESLDDFQKCKLVHDFICENFDYDLSYTNYDDYNAIFNPINEKNVMVCQGYCLISYKLLALSGIESKIIISDDESHSWNIVLLDDLWYKMDVTNDDTGYFNNTYDYMYFLKANLNGKSNYSPAQSCLLYNDLSNLEYSDNDYDPSLNNLYGINSYIYIFIFRFLLSKANYLYILLTLFLVLNIYFIFKWIDKISKKQKEKKNKAYEDYNSI